MVLTLGVLAVGLFGLPVLVFGLMAARMGGIDLLRMRVGTMDRAGRNLTKAGRLLGIIGAALAAGVIVAVCLLNVGAVWRRL